MTHRKESPLAVLSGDIPLQDKAILESALRQLGHGIFHAPTPEEAVQALARRRAPLVLATSDLSERDREVLVSGIRRLKAPLLLLLTSPGTYHFPGDPYPEEVYDLVPLPLIPPLLSAALRRALETGRLRKRASFCKKLVWGSGLLILLFLITGGLAARGFHF